jgi:iron complex outermembrane receptor protein
VLPGATGKLKVNETNFLANISYKFTRDIMAYFNYSDGFKSGGFTQRLAGPPFISPPRSRRNTSRSTRPASRANCSTGACA